VVSVKFVAALLETLEYLARIFCVEGSLDGNNCHPVQRLSEISVAASHKLVSERIGHGEHLRLREADYCSILFSEIVEELCF
jgi:hypothetical protein